LKNLENQNPPREQAVEGGVKSTRALIQTFLQTLKACRLYEPNHPILPKFLDRLKRDFDHYFNERDSFSLQVGERRLLYYGTAVYESQDVRESLAFLFFKDGIREIRFSRGLEFREIVDFLDVVRKSDFVNPMEDDLVTLLWEKDFSHIAFTTMDDFLEESSSAPAEAEDLLKGLGEGLKEEGSAGQSEEGLTEESLEQVLNPLPGQSLVQACNPNPDEMEQVNREVQEEQQPGYVYVLIGDLIEIMLHLGEDVDAHENMISYFERLIHSLLEQKEVGKAVAILKHLNDTLESMSLGEKQAFAIQRILAASSSPKCIGLLEAAANQEGRADSECIFQYLRLLTEHAIDPLCRSLGGVGSERWKKMISEVLVERLQKDIRPLIKFLSDTDPSLVSSILIILRKIGHPSTVGYLGSLVTHKDSKVREETLQILGKFGERGGDLVQEFLKDPQAEIRGKASLILARTAKSQAAKPLLEVILSEDFHKRDYQEKASFFRAVGETGSEEVISPLKKIARRRWFQRAKWKEMRLCANNALRMIEAGIRVPVSGVKS